jgi:hypothetical protein
MKGIEKIIKIKIQIKNIIIINIIIRMIKVQIKNIKKITNKKIT